MLIRGCLGYHKNIKKDLSGPQVHRFPWGSGLLNRSTGKGYTKISSSSKGKEVPRKREMTDNVCDNTAIKLSFFFLKGAA